MTRDSNGSLLRDGASVIRRRWEVIAVAVAVAATAAFVLSVSGASVYSADVEVLIEPRGRDEVLGDRVVSLDERAVRTEIRVIESEAVRSMVADELGLDDDPPVAEARAIGDTDVVSITVKSAEAINAQLFAEAYANAYVEFRREQAVSQLLAASTQVESVISDLTERIDGLGDDDPERAALESQRATFVATLDQLRVDAALQTGGAVVIKPASIPETPAGPTPLRNTALAALAGLLIGSIAAFVLERLDDTVRSVGQLEALTDQPLLGRIPVDPPADRGPLALTAYGRTSVEAYRDLRTSMGALVGDEPLGTIQITSALSGEGKTAVATNLAVVLAQAGHRVALVDADLRRPQIHDAFGISVGPGVTDLIRGVPPKDVVQHVDVGSGERLSIFTSGAVPPNPSEILSGRRMRKLLTRLGEHYDYVVVDSVPVLPVTDSVALAAVVDEVIVVSLAGSVRAAEVEETIRRLDRVDANVVGFVLNQAPMLPSSIEEYGPDPRPTTAEDLEADASPEGDAVEAEDPSDPTSGNHSDRRDDAVQDPEPGEQPVAGDDDVDVLLADA